MCKIINKHIIFCLLVVPGMAFSAQDIVAYLANTGIYWQVWTMNPDGSAQKQITDSPVDKNHIAWYPDGKHILVSSNEGAPYKVNIVTKSSIIVSLPVTGMQDAVVSPDGKNIVFSLSIDDDRDNNHIWLIDSDGNNLRKLTNKGGLQHEPVWSPDGKWIYFLSKTSGQAHDIWRVSIDGKSTEQLTVGQLYHFDLAVFNDRKIAFSSNRTGNYEIWVRDNGKDTSITDNDVFDGRPTWSSDANELIYESSNNGIINLWRISTGKNQMPKQLTHYKHGARFPIWWNMKHGNP